MDVMEPGAAIGWEIATGERAEAELDSFISRRHEQRRKSEPERELEAAWVDAEKTRGCPQTAREPCRLVRMAYGPGDALRPPERGARGSRGGPDG